MKRARTQQHDAVQAQPDLPGREQLLLTSPEMQTRLGQKYCDEAQLLPLLLAQGLIRRVRTIEVEVRPLGGDSFKIRLEATKSTVGEAKVEIARVQGTEAARQKLYRVAVREDGKAVREDDAEPELLEDECMAFEEGAVVAMAVKESPLLWRTFPEEYVATQVKNHEDYEDEEGEELDAYAHVTTGIELTEGRHYWEVALLSENVGIYVGVSRPNLDHVGDYLLSECTEGWFIGTHYGVLIGNGKQGDDGADPYDQGDRVGVLLDLNNGSLLFFKNGVRNGPGYLAGSVTGPVVAAVELGAKNYKVRLHADVVFPAGHAQ
jgi:hypothetical protein